MADHSIGWLRRGAGSCVLDGGPPYPSSVRRGTHRLAHATRLTECRLLAHPAVLRRSEKGCGLSPRRRGGGGVSEERLTAAIEDRSRRARGGGQSKRHAHRGIRGALRHSRPPRQQRRRRSAACTDPRDPERACIPRSRRTNIQHPIPQQNLVDVRASREISSDSSGRGPTHSRVGHRTDSGSGMAGLGQAGPARVPAPAWRHLRRRRTPVSPLCLRRGAPSRGLGRRWQWR